MIQWPGKIKPNPSFREETKGKLLKPDILRTSHCALSYQQNNIRKLQQKLVQGRLSNTKSLGSAVPKRHIKILSVNPKRKCPNKLVGMGGSILSSSTQTYRDNRRQQ